MHRRFVPHTELAGRRSRNTGFSLHYTLDGAQKRRFQEAAACLNTEQYAEELEDSYRAVMSMQPLWGQMLEDWFRQILTAVRYGLQQDGSADEQFYQRMEDGLWQCTKHRSCFGCCRTASAVS